MSISPTALEEIAAQNFASCRHGLLTHDDSEYIYTRNLTTARSALSTISLIRRAHLIPRAHWGTLKDRNPLIEKQEITCNPRFGTLVVDLYRKSFRII